ncbi:MAG: Kdo domain containing protein, partial [Altibacter sp.]|nr:Kdo domain containing protein [Altibacter sp.]
MKDISYGGKLNLKGTICAGFQHKVSEIVEMITHFETRGTLLGDGERNTIKLFNLDELTVNVKSFKRPNLINRIAYRYFRKSKAERSYTYANTLLEKGIGTPQPIAYFENRDLLGLKDSYYV